MVRRPVDTSFWVRKRLGDSFSGFLAPSGSVAGFLPRKKGSSGSVLFSLGVYANGTNQPSGTETVRFCFLFDTIIVKLFCFCWIYVYFHFMVDLLRRTISGLHLCTGIFQCTTPSASVIEVAAKGPGGSPSLLFYPLHCKNRMWFSKCLSGFRGAASEEVFGLEKWLYGLPEWSANCQKRLRVVEKTVLRP